MPWCPNGHENYEGSAFCSTCGSPIYVAPAPPNYQPPPGPGIYAVPGPFPQPTSGQRRSNAKVYWVTGLAVAVVGVAIALLLVVNSQDSNNAHQYPANLQTNFLNACETGAPVAVCDCALKYIEQRVSLADFQIAEADIKKGGAPPQWLYDAIGACR